MYITTIQVTGVKPAFEAMRNPWNSWRKSDSTTEDGQFLIGEHDRALCETLIKGGPEHAKHTRMIQVYVTICAPRYWWMEFDTYRIGVEKVSCSTMHTLTKRGFAPSDFEIDAPDNFTTQLITHLEELRQAYLAEPDPAIKQHIWRSLIQHLPQSYLQTRTVMMSYAALRNILRQRKGHKLREWHTFRDWAQTLPWSWMLFEEANHAESERTEN